MEGREQVHTFVFRLPSDSACRHLWQSAVDHHVFFRLCHDTPQSQSPARSTSSSGVFRRSRRSIQRRDSTLTATSFVRRRDVPVNRRPSQRFPARHYTLFNGGKQRDYTAAAAACSRSTADVRPPHRSASTPRRTVVILCCCCVAAMFCGLYAESEMVFPEC